MPDSLVVSVALDVASFTWSMCPVPGHGVEFTLWVRKKPEVGEKRVYQISQFYSNFEKKTSTSAQSSLDYCFQTT